MGGGKAGGRRGTRGQREREREREGKRERERGRRLVTMAIAAAFVSDKEGQMDVGTMGVGCSDIVQQQHCNAARTFFADRGLPAAESQLASPARVAKSDKSCVFLWAWMPAA